MGYANQRGDVNPIFATMKTIFDRLDNFFKWAPKPLYIQGAAW